jgi:hypothetical protein
MTRIGIDNDPDAPRGRPISLRWCAAGEDVM